MKEVLTEKNKRDIVEVAQATSLSSSDIGVALELPCSEATIWRVIKDRNVVREIVGGKRGPKPTIQKHNNSDDDDDMDSEKSDESVEDDDDPNNDDDDHEKDDDMDGQDSDPSDNDSDNSDDSMNDQDSDLSENDSDNSDDSDEQDSDESEVHKDSEESNSDVEVIDLDSDDDDIIPEPLLSVPKLYLPRDNSNDYRNWTVEQVSQWTSQFLPDTAVDVLTAMMVDGEWLHNLYTEKAPIVSTAAPEFRRILDDVLDHLLVVHDSFLLLARDGHGGMNTVCNLLFSCKELRMLFDGYGENEPSFEAAKKRTFCYISEIFLRKTGRSTRLRNLLEMSRGALDVRGTLDAFLGNILRELSASSPRFTTTLTFLEHLFYGQEECQKCHTTKFQENSLGEVINSEHSSALKIRNGSFKESLKLQYPPLLSSRRCKWCRGEIWKTRKTEDIGQYHFMKIHGEKIQDLDFDSKVEMMGAKWEIRAMAESKIGEYGEQYVAWINVGGRWICIEDNVVMAREGEEFKDLDIKIFVFEKFK